VEYKKIKGNRHYIYDDISEFSSEHSDNTPIVNWRDGKENDWVMSDDDRIIQLLKVADLNHPNDRKNYKWAKNYVRTVVGTFVNNKNTFMDTDFDQHPNRYTFSKKIKYTNTRVKNYMDAFKNNADEKRVKKKALVLLKQERIMSEIEKSVLDVAKELGVDHKYVLNRLKCLSDNSEDDNIILQSTKELGKIIGTSVNTVKHKEVGVFGMFQGFSPEQLDTAKQVALPSKEK
jgi:predicted regulator of amino acid metabolism with ACT domain